MQERKRRKIKLDGYEKYEIDKDGIFYNAYNIPLKIHTGRKRAQVILYNHITKQQRSRDAAVLVAMTWLPKWRDALLVGLKDGSMTNLSVDNLLLIDKRSMRAINSNGKTIGWTHKGLAFNLKYKQCNVREIDGELIAEIPVRGVNYDINISHHMATVVNDDEFKPCVGFPEFKCDRNGKVLETKTNKEVTTYLLNGVPYVKVKRKCGQISIKELIAMTHRRAFRYSPIKMRDGNELNVSASNIIPEKQRRL